MTLLPFSAWIGSFALSLTLFAAPLVGRLSQKFSCRLGVFIGGLLYITGLAATSFVNDIAVMFFTFSVLTGLGSSFCRTSCFLIVAKYFNKKRSFATGSVTMGPALGLFMWGPVTQVLLDSVGWRNTFRVMALSCTLVLLLAIPFNPNIEEKDTISEDSCEEMTEPNYQDEDDGTSAKIQTGNKKFKILDFSVWKIPQYCFLVASFTLMFMCRFIPSVHLVRDHNLTMFSIVSLKYFLSLFQWHACKLDKLGACIAKCMTTINKIKLYFTGQLNNQKT